MTNLNPNIVMNTFEYILLVLVVICTICIVIVMIVLFSKKTTMSKDFDRLESKILDENRNARHELSDNIDRIRK